MIISATCTAMQSAYEAGMWQRRGHGSEGKGFRKSITTKKCGAREPVVRQGMGCAGHDIPDNKPRENFGKGVGDWLSAWREALGALNCTANSEALPRGVPGAGVRPHKAAAAEPAGQQPPRVSPLPACGTRRPFATPGTGCSAAAPALATRPLWCDTAGRRCSPPAGPSGRCRTGTSWTPGRWAATSVRCRPSQARETTSKT